jgi:chorismate mutase
LSSQKEKRLTMIKTVLVTATFAIGFIHPAAAMETMMKCDNASMMKVQSEMEAMDSSMKTQKTMAMKEMDMAKKAMKAHKSKECMMHLDSAMKATKK